MERKKSPKHLASLGNFLKQCKLLFALFRMIRKDGMMGWLYPGGPKGLGDDMEHVGSSKAPHVSKFVEFYKSVSDICFQPDKVF